MLVFKECQNLGNRQLSVVTFVISTSTAEAIFALYIPSFLVLQYLSFILPHNVFLIHCLFFFVAFYFLLSTALGRYCAIIFPIVGLSVTNGWNNSVQTVVASDYAPFTPIFSHSSTKISSDSTRFDTMLLTGKLSFTTKQQQVNKKKFDRKTR